MRIVSKKSLGKQKTCDVINSGTENFVLENGVVTHNSSVIDEANFLEVIEGSKRSDKGVYDAAEAMYNATFNRMVSRFMKAGRVPGFIVMISSRKARNSFMERKIKEAIMNQHDLNNGIFWKVKSLWQAKPEKFFPSKEFFYVDTNTFDKISPDFGEKLYQAQSKLIKDRIDKKGVEPEYIGLY